MAKPSFRIAFRVEGGMWNAYLAPPDTMEGAVLIGSVQMSLAAEPEVKRAFMEMMQLAMKHAVNAVAGVTIDKFDVHVAPEHERSGHG